MRAEWSEVGEQSLRDLERYLLRYSEQTASTWVRRVLDAARGAGESPWKHRAVPEIGEATFREALVGPYRLWFRVMESDDRIEVMVVFHGSRDV